MGVFAVLSESSFLLLLRMKVSVYNYSNIPVIVSRPHREHDIHDTLHPRSHRANPTKSNMGVANLVHEMEGKVHFSEQGSDYR